MPKSESSFRDRQGRALLLEDALLIFSPAFNPVDTTLNAANFQILINSVNTANGNVESSEVAYTNATQARISLVKTIRDATTQALNFVKSNKAWINQTKAVKINADKLRGVRPATKAVSTPDKPRGKGAQAYVELAAHLAAFNSSLVACASYAPPDTAITIATFTSHLNNFNAQNTAVANAAVALTNYRETRRILYFEGTNSLHKRFLAVKTAVKGQYGQNSAQYGTVKGITW